MKKNTKEKGSEYIGLKECFGTTTLSFTHAITGVMMSSMLTATQHFWQVCFS